MPLTEEQNSILDHLEKVRKLRQSHRLPPGLHYCGMEDFLLQHGVWFEPQPWDDAYAEGAPKNCFANALIAGRTEGLRYVEGVATIHKLPGFPFTHGWNLDAEGRLIDTTWLNTGAAYFGVEFSLGRADDAIWTGDACVLEDHRRPHPLYSQPWAGEDFAKVWKPTGSMAYLHRMEKQHGRRVRFNRNAQEREKDGVRD